MVWFYIIKKNRKSFYIVHSLDLLNRVTISHSGLLLATKKLAMYFARRVWNGILDLYIGYDNRMLVEHL